MKKIILFIFVCLFLNPSVSYAAKILKSEAEITSNGYYKVYLPGKEGREYLQGNYRDGLREGRFETYNVKTKKRLETCHYYNGEKHGLCKKYFSKSGDLFKIVEFFVGIPHGSYKEYYSNGILKKEIQYKHGRKNGVEKQYYENGRIAVHMEYILDVLTEEKRYDKNGKVIK